MKHTLFLLCFVFLLLGARAAPLEERQGLLDSLSDAFDSALEPFQPPSRNGNNDEDEETSSSRPTPRPRPTQDEDEDEDEESSSRSASRPPPPRTTRAPTRTESSAEPTTTTTSTSETTETESTTSATPTAAPTPVNPANNAQTSDANISKSDNGGGISTAGIIVAVVLSVAVLLGILLLMYKFFPPFRRWKENRAYVKMMERSYRPTLDDGNSDSFMAEKSPAMNASYGAGYGGDGLRPLSIVAARPPVAGITRKPVPTIGSGGSTGTLTPMAGDDASARMSRGEPWLPSGRR